MQCRREPALQPRGQTTMSSRIVPAYLTLGLLAAMVTVTPAARAAAAPPSPRYFPETGHNVPEPFASYWAAHGALAQFGLPLTEPYSQNGLTVQWFERARFELHAQNRDTPYEVLLGQLGREVRPPDPSAIPAGDPAARYFPESGHNLALFRAYWERHGGMALFGLPLSEEVQAVNRTDGKGYTVQYFERVRLEYHPEHKGTPLEVQLGLLGSELYRAVRESNPTAAAAGAPVPPPVTAATAPGSIELLMWQVINADRAASGVPPLALDPLVSKAAAIHVADMAANSFVEHIGSDGSRPIDRMRRVGVQVRFGSENISMECAKDPATAVRNIQAWMMAEPLAEGLYNHRWNLMYKGYSRIGIAFGLAKNGCWIMAQNFADGEPTPGSQR